MTFDELRYEIRLARSLTKGIIGINAMVAAREFAGLVKTAIEEGIDLVVAGAGFSRICLDSDTNRALRLCRLFHR